MAKIDKTLVVKTDDGYEWIRNEEGWQLAGTDETIEANSEVGVLIDELVNALQKM